MYHAIQLRLRMVSCDCKNHMMLSSYDHASLFTCFLLFGRLLRCFMHAIAWVWDVNRETRPPTGRHMYNTVKRPKRRLLLVVWPKKKHCACLLRSAYLPLDLRIQRRWSRWSSRFFDFQIKGPWNRKRDLVDWGREKAVILMFSKTPYKFCADYYQQRVHSTTRAFYGTYLTTRMYWYILI